MFNRIYNQSLPPIIILIFVSLFTNTSYASEARKLEIRQEWGEYNIDLDAREDEYIFIAYSNSSSEHVSPCGGIRIVKGMSDRGLDFVLRIIPPAEDNRWRFMFGLGNQKGGKIAVGRGFDVLPEEKPVKPNFIRSPITAKGIEAYIVPFRSVGQINHFMYIIIGRNIEDIKNNVILSKDVDFRWDLHIRDSSDFYDSIPE